jgi:hypothetical protein
LIAVLAVVLALVLLIVGGVALFGALATDAAPSSTPQATPATGKSAAASRSRPAGTSPRSSAATRLSLMIQVTGKPTRVFVTVSGNTSQVLEDSVLSTGDIRQYDDAPLDVVVADGSAVKVYIYGKLQAKSSPGQKGEWHVAKQ